MMDSRYVAHSLMILALFGTLMTSFGDQLKLSNQSATWDEAVALCKQTGGRLARAPDFVVLRYDIENELPELMHEDGGEFWVGGHLVDYGWRWETNETSIPFQNGVHQVESGVHQVESGVHQVESLGCYRQKTWTGGIILPNISAQACLDHCNWQGHVGLKSNYCLCDSDLDLAHDRENLCHMTCVGNPGQSCGGMFGIALYREGLGTVLWADGEPASQNDCGLLRRRDRESPPELISSTCQLQTRYLCRFVNDDKCGTKPTCLRWSTEQVPWRHAKRKCKTLSGELVDLGYTHDDDLRDIPPGTFWVALRRHRRWTWLDGTTIPQSAFHSHERAINPAENCSVVERVTDKLGLSTRSCVLRRRFLCQYDYTDDLAMKREATNNNGSMANASVPPDDDDIHTTTSRRTFHTITGLDSVIQGTDDNTEDKRWIVDWKFSSCELLVLGFVGGMLCMLTIGSACIVVFRCRKPIPKKKRRSKFACHHRTRDNTSVSYNSSSASVRMAGHPPDSDGMYATVSDIDKESPFRQTQRIRNEKLTSQCSGPSTQKQQTNSGSAASNARVPEYTWRGVIDGKIEIINTELQPPPGYKEQEGKQIDVTVSVPKDTTNSHLNDGTTEVDTVVERNEEEGFGDYDIPFPSSSAAAMSGETNTSMTHSAETDIPPTGTVQICATAQCAGVQDHIYASVKKVRKTDPI